jgi:hypothetical protein
MNPRIGVCNPAYSSPIPAPAPGSSGDLPAKVLTCSTDVEISFSIRSSFKQAARRASKDGSSVMT